MCSHQCELLSLLHTLLTVDPCPCRPNESPANIIINTKRCRACLLTNAWCRLIRCLLHLIRSTSRRLLATKQARTAATTATLSIPTTLLYNYKWLLSNLRTSAHAHNLQLQTYTLILPSNFLLLHGSSSLLSSCSVLFLIPNVEHHRSRVNPLCNPLMRLHTMRLRGHARYACGQR